MKARSKELLDRAIEAMVAAIGVYNLPNLPYRAESFTILVINAWELLLKAKWLVEHKNRLTSLYVLQDGAKKRRRYKRTRSGTPQTHSIEYLARKLSEEKILDEAARRNIEAVVELRDGAVHFYHHNLELVEQIQEIGMACIKNFAAAVQDWFGRDLSDFYTYPIPLSFDVPRATLETVSSTKEAQKLLQYLNTLKTGYEDATARYSVAVNMELRFVRSRSLQATEVRLTSDPSALPVRLTDRQLYEQYPWDYWELTQQCRKRYANFKADKRYHRLRKSLEGDQRFAYVRYLDPEKPTSVKKKFYSQAILKEFDKCYTVKG